MSLLFLFNCFIILHGCLTMECDNIIIDEYELSRNMKWHVGLCINLVIGL